MLRALLLLGCLLVATASAQQGPQPFLLVKVVFPVEGRFSQEIGTVAPDIGFDYFYGSPDRQDSVVMHAKFLKKTSEGFHISWTVVQRRGGKEVAHFSISEVVPWGARKRMKSVPEYTAEVFYSAVPATALKPFGSNQTMERTADRRENSFSMITVSDSKATLAFVSGRSSYSR